MNVLKKIWRGWLKVAHAIGRFNTRVILTVIYLVVFTGYGLVVRLFRRDPLGLKADPARDPLWRRREAKMEREGFFRQF